MQAATSTQNILYYGDCLTIMREKMPPQSVDLVYLDPPFNSKRDYNAIYTDNTGRPLPDQVEAFNDTWILDNDKMRIIRNLPVLLSEHGVNGHGADLLSGFLSALCHTQPDMAAYLAYMTERLVWIRRTMKESASVYLHCDSTASHYLKVMMDVVFGRHNFANEITWKRYAAHSLSKTGFDNISDCLLLYCKNFSKAVFPKVFGEVSDSELATRFPHIEEGTGRRYQHIALEQSSNRASAGESRVIQGRTVRSDIGWRWTQKTFDQRLAENPDLIHWTANGRPRYKSYADAYAGAPLGNIWVDVNYLSAGDGERLGYPTQKPVALLERIIRASSNPGAIVFDPFCGCATTIEAASKLNRGWIGIDITIHAIRRVARLRLHERLHLVEGKDYAIDGVPKNWEGAFELWKQDPYQFQKWCVELVEGFVNVKKTADDGIDGRIYFDMPGEKVLQCMALEVKGGTNVGPADVGYLNSVLQYENVQMAGLVTLHQPGAQQMKNFQQKMALADDVEIAGRLYPRMQMLTVDEILNGAKFNMPSPAARTGTGYETDLWNAPAQN